MVKCLLLLIFICSSGAYSLNEKVITASPALTEIWFQIGKASDVIAASQFSDYPKEAKTLPRIGTLFLPSIEKTLVLNPGWVLLDAFTKSPLFEDALEALKIKHLTFRVDSARALFHETEKALKAVYGESTSKFLEDERLKWDTWKKKPHKAFSFIAFTWGNPAILIGRSTYLSDLFQASGGTNLLPENITTPYPQVSEEWLLKQKPEIVYFLEESSQSKLEYLNLTEKWWPHLKPHLIGLNPAFFARTSFTPLAHLEELEWSQ